MPDASTFDLTVEKKRPAARRQDPDTEFLEAAVSDVTGLPARLEGVDGEPGFVAYGASKGAVVQMTRCMALDHAAEGIRVNAVCPGETHTQMLDRMLRDQGGDFDENLRNFAAGIPMRRVASANEVARCIVFLASDDASCVTGTTLVVDGRSVRTLRQG